MKITGLGTGTSSGIPQYLCDCETCEDARLPGSKNRRTRPSVHVEANGAHLQFDTGPNFLDQIDDNRVERIDAVFYTHCHADHISGTNDLVMPARRQKMDMPIYGPVETIRVLERNYDYMFSRKTFQGGGVAHLIPHVVDSRFDACGVELLPIPVVHGVVSTCGYRIGPLGYVPDAKRVPEASLEMLRGVEVLMIDALSFNPRHPTHLSVGESAEIAEQVGAKVTYLTHMMHRLDHRFFHEQCDEQDVDLPERVHLAYDGQVIEI